MSEWEKMIRGEIYNDFSKELFDKRVKAKKLFKAYNKTEDEEIEKRNELLKELFGEIGKDVWIEPDFRCEYGKNIFIGDNVYINFGCVILDCAKVEIGSHSLLGPNIGIYALNHMLDPEERISGGIISKGVIIEKNVWLGGDVKIMAGVTIGEGAVIGAGSIVTKDIPPRVIAAGNPCRIIREITDKDKTEYQKKIRKD